MTVIPGRLTELLRHRLGHRLLPQRGRVHRVRVSLAVEEVNPALVDGCAPRVLLHSGGQDVLRPGALSGRRHLLVEGPGSDPPPRPGLRG